MDVPGRRESLIAMSHRIHLTLPSRLHPLSSLAVMGRVIPRTLNLKARSLRDVLAALV